MSDVLAPLLTSLTRWRNPPEGGRSANHTSYVYAVGTSLPMVPHSCLACLQWKNPDAGNYSTRQCAASGIKTPFLKKIGEPFFQPLSGISLRPPQTCFRTCGYLFRALQEDPGTASFTPLSIRNAINDSDGGTSTMQ